MNVLGPSVKPCVSPSSPQPPSPMRFVLLLVALTAGIFAYLFSAGTFLSVSKVWGVTGPSLAGDFHGATYSLKAHSMELLEDDSTVMIWTRATFPGGPDGLAYAVIVRGLDWKGPFGLSSRHSSRANSHDKGLLAEFEMASGGAAISLAYAVDMVPPGPDDPRGMVECQERLLGSFLAGSVNVAAEEPMDLGSGRVFVAEVSEEGVKLDQFDVDLSVLDGVEFSADELYARIQAE